MQLADHDYVVIGEGNGRYGRILLRGRVATLKHFGLYAFPGLELAYERNGGIQIGQYRTSPRKVNWQVCRIGTPERYPCGSGYVGWNIATSANCRIRDLQVVAQAIEASGAPWTGFQKKSGARWLDKHCLLKLNASAA